MGPGSCSVNESVSCRQTVKGWNFDLKGDSIPRRCAAL